MSATDTTIPFVPDFFPEPPAPGVDEPPFVDHDCLEHAQRDRGRMDAEFVCQLCGRDLVTDCPAPKVVTPGS